MRQHCLHVSQARLDKPMQYHFYRSANSSIKCKSSWAGQTNIWKKVKLLWNNYGQEFHFKFLTLFWKSQMSLQQSPASPRTTKLALWWLSFHCCGVCNIKLFLDHVIKTCIGPCYNEAWLHVTLNTVGCLVNYINVVKPKTVLNTVMQWLR